jgi:GNAT superfamily N-acetyltransferase
MSIHKWLWPNRAADPKQEDIIERAYPCFDGIWSGDRAESWYLEQLAVHPSFQGKGVGYKLVQWGLEQAQNEGVVASVVSALGKNDFYRKCGFDVQDGSACEDGEGNPLKGVEGGDVFWRWPKTAS